MEQIISLVVANGIFAVLFCGLLVYELKDSRAREGKYMQTIRVLGDRLQTLSAVKADTDGIKVDIADTAGDVHAIRADTDTIKRAVIGGKKRGGSCAET